MRLLLVLLGSLTVGSAVQAAESPTGTRCLEFRTYYAVPGHLGDLSARFRDRVRPLFEKHGIRCVGFWMPKENPDQRLMFLLAYEDRGARDAAWAGLLADPVWQSTANDSLAGRWVSRVDNVFLEPTDYSPELQVKASDPARIFELCTYTAARGRRAALNRRCRDATRKLLAKHGVEQIGFWVPMRDQKGAEEKLLYLVAHKDREAASAARTVWQDPEWLEAKKAFEEQAGGPLTVSNGVESTLLVPTEYSALR